MEFYYFELMKLPQIRELETYTNRLFHIIYVVWSLDRSNLDLEDLQLSKEQPVSCFLSAIMIFSPPTSAHTRGHFPPLFCLVSAATPSLFLFFSLPPLLSQLWSRINVCRGKVERDLITDVNQRSTKLELKLWYQFIGNIGVFFVFFSSF